MPSQQNSTTKKPSHSYREMEFVSTVPPRKNGPIISSRISNPITSMYLDISFD